MATSEQQPPFGSAEWQRQFEQSMAEAGRQIGTAFSQAGNIFAAQGAMGWAFRGDVEKTRAALANMTPDQVREVSAAASMLAALADEELSTR